MTTNAQIQAGAELKTPPLSALEWKVVSLAMREAGAGGTRPRGWFGRMIDGTAGLRPKLPLADPLSRAKLLVAAGLEMQGSARIRLAAELSLDNLPAVLLARITETVETGMDPVTGSVLARRRRRLQPQSHV